MLKSWEQYLIDNNNDPAAAAAAMRRDASAETAKAQAEVQTEIGKNVAARKQAQAYRKLLARIGVDTDALDSDGISRERRDELLADIATAADKAVAALTTGSSELADTLTSAGFDVAAWRAAGADKRKELEKAFVKSVKDGSAEAVQLRQELNLRDLSTELGVDPKKVSNLRGSEGIKRGKVKTKVKAEDGTETESEVDGWVTADDKPITEWLTGAGFTVEQLAPAPKAEEPKTEDSHGAQVSGGQKPAAGAASETSWMK